MKIGILTFYYDTINYGGALQAYALCKKIEQMGYIAEQIAFDTHLGSLSNKRKITIKWIFSATLKILPKIRSCIKSRRMKAAMEKWKVFANDRHQAFKNFLENLTPHSPCVFTEDTICKANEMYDAFITGSDQVWNVNWYNPIYFLDFANKSKYTFSYAAGALDKELTKAKKAALKRHFSRLNAISVRESSSVKRFSPLVNKPIEYVLDPTLLLSEDDWSQIAEAPAIKEKYIFCYFLTNNESERKLATEFAERNGYKLANIPFMNYKTALDQDFGDISDTKVSPEKFLGLIQNAEFIFTDSFHASVFSLIFKKKFVVFSRMEEHGMDNRIHSLLDIFDCEERFCNTNERATMDYIDGLNKLDYSHKFPKYKEMKKKSLEFLKINLEKAGAYHG